jgi:hypothetical protein
MRRQVFTSVVTLALLALGCGSPSIKGTGAGGAGGSTNPGRAGSSGSGAGGSGGFVLPDAAPSTTTDAPVAVQPDSGPCQKLSCSPTGGKYCGKIGDGCGGTMECGADCPMGLTCGGGGVKNLCGAPRDPNCKAITCEQMGGRLCGRVGDGCGGSLECGECPGGATCGGAGLPNVCGNGSGPTAGCDNLCKQQVMCPPGQETTVTGTVFAPTPPQFGMADPLYNALVYVPNKPLAPFPAGVACDLCGTPVSGSPLITVLTGPDGKFTLKNVPVGDNIPLVIQIGRWRREVKLPKVTACTSMALPAELTRLPRNQQEGNIPQMAIATGQYDPFECVLRKVGIDVSEFTPPSGTGRVHVYRYEGARLAMGVTPPGGQLVGGVGANMGALDKYDMVLLPCDDDSPKLVGELRALQDYTAKGGRLFLTDFSYSWLHDEMAGGLFAGRGQWLPETEHVGDDYTTVVDQSFPKGQAFAEWLRVVGASTTLGQLPIHDPYNGASYFDGVVAPTQRWLYTEAPVKTVQHFTFNTPVNAAADKQCGRVVFSTFHVAEENLSLEALLDPRFPRDCTNKPMTPQEKALEFMLFDASACVQPDTERPRVFEPPPPAPPPPPPVVD